MNLEDPESFQRIRRVRSTIALFLFIGVAGLAGCKKEVASAPPPPAPPEVAVMTVTAQNIPDDPEFIGQAESSRPVEIRSQVTGIIKQRFFQEGREVKKGDRLYQIDPVPFQAAFSSAKARVAQSDARLAQAKQNINRLRPLLNDQAVSQKEVDDAASEELTAAAVLEGAKGDLAKAQFDLDNTLILAPITGMIERTRVYEGRLVSAQSDLLTVVHQVNPIYVTVNAPESYFLQRRKEIAEKKGEQPDIYHLRGIITFSDGSTYPHEGVLDFADVVYHVETGSRQGRFVFPNPERILLPGQFLKVRVKGYTRTGAILVPQRAVQQGAKGSIVYVIGADNKVEVRDVQATAWRGDQWLMESGLKPGERVVVEGIQRIMPGATVKPVPVAENVASPPAQKLEAKKEGTR
ncbi:MAG: efflux RND transporter periplasmic adaptor subunit [Nitrospirae bacterium]|nr:efflux RND transporter periplasmic adaptor subunit [Candidatus Manganitrophaceae bacterium]